MPGKFITVPAQNVFVDISENLSEIERRFESGEDVRRDFWKLVGEVKRSGIEDEEIIERISRIRDALFGRRMVMGFRKGFILFSVLFALFNILFFIASLVLENGPFKAIAILGAEIGVIYSSFLTGRCIGAVISGIGVDGFYRYTPLELGVKMNYRSYLRARPESRVILFSAAIVLEHLILAAHTLFLMSINSYWIIPALILAANLPFSYLIHKYARTGELHRLLRELRILRDIRKQV